MEKVSSKINRYTQESFPRESPEELKGSKVSQLHFIVIKTFRKEKRQSSCKRECPEWQRQRLCLQETTEAVGLLQTGRRQQFQYYCHFVRRQSNCWAERWYSRRREEDGRKGFEYFAWRRLGRRSLMYSSLMVVMNLPLKPWMSTQRMELHSIFVACIFYFWICNKFWQHKIHERKEVHIVKGISWKWRWINSNSLMEEQAVPVLRHEKNDSRDEKGSIMEGKSSLFQERKDCHQRSFFSKMYQPSLCYRERERERERRFHCMRVATRMEMKGKRHQIDNTHSRWHIISVELKNRLNTAQASSLLSMSIHFHFNLVPKTHFIFSFRRRRLFDKKRIEDAK